MDVKEAADKVIDNVGDVLERELLALRKHNGPTLKHLRREKFLEMGKHGLN